MKYKVYGLFSELNLEQCKYVGYTQNTLKYRLSQHIRRVTSKNEPNKYKANWIMSCLNNQVKIHIKLLGSYATKEEMYKGEIYHIAQMRKNGHKLTNMTDGGEKSGSPSLEVRKKISAKAMGHKRNVGRKHRPEHGIKVSLSKLGKKREDLSQRQMGSDNKMAKLTEEDVINIRRLAKTERNKDIAAKYQISSASVCDIKSGRTWKHLISSCPTGVCTL